MRNRTLLCYNVAGDKYQKIAFLAARLKIRMRVVREDEYDIPLERLEDDPPPLTPEGEADLPSTAREGGAAEAFRDEMLVIVGFPPVLINDFLQDYRKLKIEPIALKAVLTPTNRKWTSRELNGELKREHEAVGRGQQRAHS